MSVPTLSPRVGLPGGHRGWSAARYRAVFGWDVEYRDGRTLLALGHGVVAVTVPEAIAAAVARRLRAMDAEGPVFAVEGPRSRRVFLADPNGFVTGHLELPGPARVLDCWQRIALPGADARAGGRHWIIPPDARQRWLPTLAAVVRAVRPWAPLAPEP